VTDGEIKRGAATRPEAPPVTSPSEPPDANGASARRATTWVRTYGRDTFYRFDFIGGCGAAIAVFVVTLIQPRALRDNGVVILAACVGLGVALLAVVLTAMAIVGALSPEYRRVLNYTPGGVAAALMPFQTIAAICGLATVAALAGLIIGSAGPPAVDGAGNAAIALLVVWSVLGTVDLVGHTAFHASSQARIEKGVDDANVLHLKRSRDDG
jgi:hypothetical protein